MLSGVLCLARHKPWLLTPLSFSGSGGRSNRLPSTTCRLDYGGGRAASIIWHAISYLHKPAFHHEQKGEGSWNVSWDARPARWLHRPESAAWLLFGVCASLTAPAPAPAPLEFLELTDEQHVVSDKIDGTETISSDSCFENSANYRVTGVLADGRCLFRAIAHMASLRNGEEAPDEKRQTELADKLRAQVVNELLMRRKESEWFIEGDFDAYVERLRQPYVWGGEPELLMASYVLRTMISVYMLDRSSGSLINIANYGEDYQKDGDNPIKVLFHGYGHYDILETVSEQSCEKAEA